MRLALHVMALVFLFACGGAGGNGPTPVPAQGPALSIDGASNLGSIPATLFGVNTPWEDLGQGITAGGELVQDRSFRTFGTASSPWSGLPGQGALAAQASGGEI